MLAFYAPSFNDITTEITQMKLLYFSQKPLLRKMKSRLDIIEYAGYVFWQLFLQRLQLQIFMMITDVYDKIILNRVHVYLLF